MSHDYLRDGDAIYQRSFAIIRAETDLSRFSADEADIVVRMVHACGSPEAAAHIEFGHGLVAAARAALASGAPVLCDSEMVAHGVTRARLPKNNDVLCTLRDPRVPALAQKLGTTRSAAALELWRERLAGVGGRHRQCADRAVSSARHAGAAARRSPPPSSAFRSASSAPPNPRTRSPPIRAACLT